MTLSCQVRCCKPSAAVDSKVCMTVFTILLAVFSYLIIFQNNQLSHKRIFAVHEAAISRNLNAGAQVLSTKYWKIFFVYRQELGGSALS